MVATPTTSSSPSTPGFSSSSTRISGLVSGMDTDSIVKKLMTAESAQYNKMKQDKQKYTWQSDAYRQWNSDLFSFRSNILFNMKMSSPYGTFNVSTSQSNTSLNSVSGTANANAIEGTYTMSVASTAKAATFSGTPTIGLNDSLVTDGSTQTLTITLGDGRSKNITLGTQGDANTLNDLIGKINTLTDSNGNSMGLQALYDTTLNKFTISTKNQGAATSIQLSSTNNTILTNKLGITNQAPNALIGGSITNANAPLGARTVGVTIGGKTVNISLSSTDKIGDLVNKLNTATFITQPNPPIPQTFNNSSDTLQASYNATNHQFMLTTTSGQSVSLDSATSALLGIQQVPAQTFFASGQDAKATFSGQNISVPSNTTTIYGVSYSLKNKTIDPNTRLDSPATVTVSRDIDAEVKNIKDFVTNYNNMIDKVYKAITEPVYRDYQPLTDDQRSAMTDTQITQWETKAKSGLLNNDSILTSLYNQMRSHMSAIVNNGSSYNTLSSIGISSTSYTDRGKLTVDDTKLRAALQADPQGVQNLFSQSDDTDQTKNGVVSRLYNDFYTAFTATTQKAGATGNPQNDQSTIGQLLSDISTKITNEQSRLQGVQDNYYKQFTAMETALSKYNAQSSYLSQQFAGGSNSSGA